MSNLRNSDNDERFPNSPVKGAPHPKKDRIRPALYRLVPYFTQPTAEDKNPVVYYRVSWIGYFRKSLLTPANNLCVFPLRSSYRIRVVLMGDYPFGHTRSTKRADVSNDVQTSRPKGVTCMRDQFPIFGRCRTQQFRKETDTIRP